MKQERRNLQQIQSPLVCKLRNYETSEMAFTFPNNCDPKLIYYTYVQSLMYITGAVDRHSHIKEEK